MVSLLGVSGMVEELERDRCFSSPDHACLIVQSLQTAGKIGDVSDKAWALHNIAAAQAEAGDMKGALRTADKIGKASSKASALNDIAAAQAEAGDLKGARTTVKSARAIVKSALAARKNIDGLSGVMFLVGIAWALVEQQ